jgi:hypothetical protein
MAADTRDSDARTVWQLQRTDPVPVDIADIRRRSLKFRRQVWRRNLGEYAASTLVVAFFGSSVWLDEGFWTRTGALLVIGGTLYMCYQLHKRAAARTASPGANSVVFHRGELERQRDALQGVWRWYLAPFVPGLIVHSVGQEIDSPPISWVPLLLKLAFGAAVFIYFIRILKLNQLAAGELQREIDELKELERDD